MFILLAALIFTSGYNVQTKYDYCESIEFKGEYCSLQKKLNKYEKEKK